MATVTIDDRTDVACDGCGGSVNLMQSKTFNQIMDDPGGQGKLDAAMGAVGYTEAGGLHYCQRCGAIHAEDPQTYLAGRLMTVSEVVLQATEGAKELRPLFVAHMAGGDYQDKLEAAKTALKNKLAHELGSPAFSHHRPDDGVERAAYDRRHHVVRLIRRAEGAAGEG